METNQLFASFKQEKLRNLGVYKSQKLKEYFEANLAKDFICLSQAPYNLQILFIQKKNKSLKFYINYQNLNAITKRNCYFLLLIKKAIIQIEGYKYLTKINIILAFNCIRIDFEYKDAMLFITSFGIYCYWVMFFGLINGPVIWQNYINNILFEYLNVFCQAYIDNILIYSKICKKYYQYIKLVLDKLY